MAAPAPAKAPRVEVGTALAEAPDRATAFADAVAATAVDPQVWTGAFATNVWGGRYEIDTVLARGGQGTTFAGTDRKTGARVAVKIFDLKNATEWKKVDLFEREVQTLKSVEHPRLPAYIDLIEDDDSGARALVMTHVPGDNLADVLRREGPLQEAALWGLVVDVADVLRALHGQPSPLVHRDLKPQNLIRRPDGNIAVVDLGGVGHARGTAGSTVVGTFGYMAPEQLYGTSSTATDMYALGATLLTLATGTEPEDQPRKGLRIDVDQAAPHLSAPLRELLKKLLSPEPEQRPHDALELEKELHRIARTTPRAGAPTSEGAAAPEADTPWAHAHWPEPPQADLEEAGTVAAGIISLVVGILGTVAVVVLGEVLIPLVLSLVAAFATPANRRKLESARTAVQQAARTGRKQFEQSVERGASALKEVDHRSKRRRIHRPKGPPPPPRPPRAPGRNRRRGG